MNKSFTGIGALALMLSLPFSLNTLAEEAGSSQEAGALVSDPSVQANPAGEESEGAGSNISNDKGKPSPEKANSNGRTLLPVTMITATRVESAIETAPGSVTVVTRDDIDKTPRAGIKELVRNLEGVVTGQLRGQSDLAASIEMRGVSGQARNMVMIDGIPLNTSYSGQIQAIGGLGIEDLKQVEVVRGPFSSLYGSSAMGGVVNFITAMPDKSEYRLNIGYGDAFHEGRAQKDLVKGNVSVAEKFNDALKVKISYGWMDSGGYKSDFVTTATAPAGVTGYYSSPSATGGTQYIVGNRGFGAVNKHDVLSKVELKPTDEDVMNFTYMKSNLHNQYNNPETFLVNGAGVPVYSAGTNPRESSFLTNINDVTSSIYALDWKHRLQDSNLSLKYSNLYVDEWYATAATTATLAGGVGTLTPRISENSILDLMWQKPWGASMLLLGTQFKQTDSIADTYGLSNWKDPNSRTTKTTSSGGKEKVIALFADWQSEITPSLTTSLGGRFERWTGHDGYTADYTQPANTTLNRQYAPQTKNNFSPKLTMGYQIAESTRIKASWGTAFRAPDALVLYRNYGTTTQYVSNPALKPERSQSVDIGIEQGMADNGLFKAYLFHTEITDLISTRDLNLAGTIKERINVGRAKSEGYELSLVQPFSSDFKLSTNYTKMFTKVLENAYEPASVGKQLTYVPRDMFNLGLGYDDSLLYGTLNYQYMGKRFLNTSNNDVVTGVYGSYDPYSLVNTKVGYRLTQHFDVSLAISNLLDRKFYNSVLTEGRAWFAQANIKF